MSDRLISRVRSFNRAVTRSIGVLEDNYLGRKRPLGEARLLFEIGRHGASASDLRARLGLDSGYLSRLLRSLEAQGLVITSPHSLDRRITVAELTHAGVQELGELEKNSDEVARSILSRLSKDQRVRLGEAMREVERLLTLSWVQIADERPTSRDAQHCLKQYYAELESRFEGGFEPHYDGAPSVDEFVAPAGAFLVMRLHGKPVGCGGLKRLSRERAYIKRMWVSPSARGLGLGRLLLEALEAKAQALGYKIVCLETNRSLKEAQRLYRTAGYREVKPFNAEPYAHHWFEKSLAAEGEPKSV